MLAASFPFFHVSINSEDKKSKGKEHLSNVGNGLLPLDYKILNCMVQGSQQTAIIKVTIKTINGHTCLSGRHLYIPYKIQNYSSIFNMRLVIFDTKQ